MTHDCEELGHTPDGCPFGNPELAALGRMSTKAYSAWLIRTQQELHATLRADRLRANGPRTVPGPTWDEFNGAFQKPKPAERTGPPVSEIGPAPPDRRSEGARTPAPPAPDFNAQIQKRGKP